MKSSEKSKGLGSQTMGFHPTDYVDITTVRERKKAALVAHKSQGGEEIYREYHQPMEDFRGRESGHQAAEAFVHLARKAEGCSFQVSGNIPG